MSNYTKAKILVHTSIGTSYYRLVLRAPEAASGSLPGQFIMLRVSDTMDPILARPFSISSVISNRTLEIVYRIAGRGTRMLTQCKPGQSLDMIGPLGNGFSFPERTAVPVLITGGSGFPPIHFLSAWLRQKKRSSMMFIGAKNRACLPPPSIIRSFKRNGASIKVATEDGSAGTRGLVTRIVEPFLATSSDTDRIVVYACGPRAMLMAVSGLAKKYSVSCSVSMEERMACGLGACMGCAVPMKKGGYNRVCKEGPVFNADDIAWSSPDTSQRSLHAQCCSPADDIMLP